VLEGKEMRSARWRLRSLFVTVAVIAVSLAGAVKWRRYSELRDRIATYAREEGLILAEYRQSLRIRRPCGNELRHRAALLGVATERRHRIKECEQAIARLW
jgi:hypothetical protein